MTHPYPIDDESSVGESKPFQGWLRMNPESEAVEGALFLEEMLQRVAESKYHWKWATMALFNLTYSTFVLALKGTWPVQLLTNQQRGKTLKNQHILDFDESVWTGNAAAFRTLYKRVLSEEIMARYYQISKALAENDDQFEGIEWLADRRDQFVHFKAESSAHELTVFPDQFLKVLEVVRFLVEDSGNICHFDDGFCLPLRASLERTEQQLQFLKSHLQNVSPNRQH